MTEKYEQAQMDVVEFPDVDIITTSDLICRDEATAHFTEASSPGDRFLE